MDKYDIESLIDTDLLSPASEPVAPYAFRSCTYYGCEKAPPVRCLSRGWAISSVGLLCPEHEWYGGDDVG